MRSETTAAAKFKKEKEIRHDPFAMKPLFGYGLLNTWSIGSPLRTGRM